VKYSLSQLDTIIFDLGEVIVDLDANAVISAFKKLTGPQVINFKSVLIGSSALYDYETGVITKSQFVNQINREMGTLISLGDFEKAWNLMIKTIPRERLELLERLKNTHRVLILSNTNCMHEDRFDAMVEELTGQKMSHFSHAAYYSHTIGKRKPNMDIYEYIIEDQKLNPSKALFLDDKMENIEAARRAGLKAEQVLKPDDIFSIISL
jgi:HAD superfamily hydrolase (TIGR01509 family)